MLAKIPTRFTNANAARKYLEALLWKNGRSCPHCGVIDESTALKGQSTRPGVYWCNACQKPFSVTVGTLYERSKVPLNTWLYATHLLCTSKKGISSHQLHRMLGVTYKTAWFMAHRIREAMKDGTPNISFGSGGGSVEADETFIGKDPDARPTPVHANPSWVEKQKILALVDRNTKQMRSFAIKSLSAKDIQPILLANIAKEARLLTDEAPRYISHGRMFADHQSVNHAKDEYVRQSDSSVHTNTVEGAFSVFKRGMKGIYQHCSPQHLQRYLTEFDFRYSNRIVLGIDDATRADRALKGAVGKRLTYRRMISRTV